MSPRWIMIGASTAKFTSAPNNTLVATRIPISPPTPSIAASSVKRKPSCRTSVPMIFGIQRLNFAAAL